MNDQLTKLNSEREEIETKIRLASVEYANIKAESQHRLFIKNLDIARLNKNLRDINKVISAIKAD